ncbi:MAG: hypothetical protein HXY40_03140 [Chloroflexi bacterium]|nr:hypothetical protein [Chloroflexota bacterium]
MSDAYPHGNLIRHIRQYPHLYLPDIQQRGLYALLAEALAYPLTQALAGRCSRISLALEHNRRVYLSDNSPGLDPYPIASVGLSPLEMHMLRRSLPPIAAAELAPLYGVGLPLVNALSQEMWVESRYDGALWGQGYSCGFPQTRPQRRRALELREGSGLLLRFTPDAGIFAQRDYHYDWLTRRLRELAFLVRGLELHLYDERIGLRDTFLGDEGLAGYVRYLNRGQTPLHQVVTGGGEIEAMTVGSSSQIVRIEFAFQYIDTAGRGELAFVNTQPTTGGMHQRALRAALLYEITRYARATGLLSPYDSPLSLQEVTYSLTAVVSLYHLYTRRGGQKIPTLPQQEVWKTMLSAVMEMLALMQRRNPQAMRRIVEQCLAWRR